MYIDDYLSLKEDLIILQKVLGILELFFISLISIGKMKKLMIFLKLFMNFHFLIMILVLKHI